MRIQSVDLPWNDPGSNSRITNFLFTWYGIGKRNRAILLFNILQSYHLNVSKLKKLYASCMVSMKCVVSTNCVEKVTWVYLLIEIKLFKMKSGCSAFRDRLHSKELGLKYDLT